PAVHDRRESQHLSVRLSVPGDQCGEPFDHAFVKWGPGIDAIGPHFVEQDVSEVVQGIGRCRLRSRSNGYIHVWPYVESCSRSMAQGGGNSAHQAGRPDVCKDSVVVDHERCRQDVAQMTTNTKVAVIAISRQPAGTHRM